MANWYFCDDTTKAIIAGGIATTEADGLALSPPEGHSVYVVADGSILGAFTGTPDFTPLKAIYKQKVNDGYSDFIAPTVSEGIVLHDLVLSMKQQEALAWTSGDEITHPENYPFMLGELQARLDAGLTANITTVHDGIVAEMTAAASLPLLDGVRVAQRAVISAADNLPDIVNAADIDWATIAAG